MDIKTIKELVAILEKSGLDEIELEDKNSSIRLVKNRATITQSAPLPQHINLPGAASSAAENSKDANKSTEDASDDGLTITSPMVGTFYSASSPDAKPFVTVGDTIKAGDVVCIVEAMKTMNKIKSTHSGKITSILSEDGKPVEFGQKLFLVE